MTEPAPLTAEQRQRYRDVRAVIMRYRYGARREIPQRAMVLPEWLWDLLEERDRPWFTAARDAGLIRQRGDL